VSPLSAGSRLRGRGVLQFLPGSSHFWFSKYRRIVSSSTVFADVQRSCPHRHGSIGSRRDSHIRFRMRDHEVVIHSIENFSRPTSDALAGARTCQTPVVSGKWPRAAKPFDSLVDVRPVDTGFALGSSHPFPCLLNVLSLQMLRGAKHKAIRLAAGRYFSFTRSINVSIGKTVGRSRWFGAAARVGVQRTVGIAQLRELGGYRGECEP